MRDVWPDMSRSGSFQRSILKYAGTPYKAAFTIMWRIFALFVVMKWFLCNNDTKYDMMKLWSTIGVLGRNLFSTRAWMIIFHHCSQFTDCFATVALDTILVVYRIMIVKIYRS